MTTAGVLFVDIGAIELFVVFKLREDYTNNSPYVVPSAPINLSRYTADRKQAAKTMNSNVGNSDQPNRLELALKELTFDRAHVERKLRAAALRHGQPGSDIQPLIDQCEWASLAEALAKDRMLADKILASESIYFPRGRHVEVLNGLEKIQKKYFDKIVNPSDFVISAHASTLSAEGTRADEKESGRPSPPRYQDLDPADDHIPAKTIKAHIHKYLGRILPWLPKAKTEARNSKGTSSQLSSKEFAK